MRRPGALLAVVGAVLCLLTVAEEASAQVRRASLEEGPPVRRKLLYRSSRFELMPAFGVTLNDTFKRNLMVGVDANYYLTNEFGLGVSGAFGAAALNTDLLDQIQGTIAASANDQLSYATTTLLTDLHVSYVPIFGKFALGRTIIDYDIHLIGGFGGALVSAEQGSAAPDPSFTGFKPGAVLGGGARLFFGDSVAVTLDLKDYLYSASDVQEGEAQPQSEFRDNLLVMLGVSFFFPGEVPVSR